jgi:hypothetical protein
MKRRRRKKKWRKRRTIRRKGRGEARMVKRKGNTEPEHFCFYEIEKHQSKVAIGSIYFMKDIAETQYF